MKKAYIIPTIGITLMEAQNMFCQSETKGAMGRFGNETGNYGRPEWVNEQQSETTSQDGLEGVEIGENNATIDSRAKSSMIWDEW